MPTLDNSEKGRRWVWGFNVDSKSDRFGVDFEGDSFHLGSMSLSWETIDNEDGTLTTHFTVDDKGFVDHNYVGEYIDILNDYTSDTGETLAFIFNFFLSMLFAGLVFLILRIFRAKKHG